MADTQLATILNSGNIATIYIGGATTPFKAVVFGDLSSDNISFDDTGLGITALTAQAALAALAEVGLVVMSGNGLVPQSITTSPTKVLLFDTKNVEAGVGAAGDISLHRATATLNGVFKLRFEAFLSYASNIDITWQIYKNGVAFGNSITLAGQGTKIFPITLLTSAEFLANDYIELYATASATADITISQVNGTLEKTIF